MYRIIIWNLKGIFMISMEFSFSDFISAIKDKNELDILRLAEAEAKDAEKLSEIKGYGQDYVDAVTGLIYFLRYHQKPYGIMEKHFQMFRPVCENLVAKHQLPSDVLNILNSREY